MTDAPIESLPDVPANIVPANIFLIGMMGAGKTSVGRVLAKRLGKDFHDSDHEVVQRTGATVPLIFDIEGEAGFRTRETAVLFDLIQLRNIVLATGGGVVLLEENRALLRRSGCVVYLRATVQELWQRTRHDKNRPLLQTADPQAKLAELYAVRDPLYIEIADIVIDSSRQSPRNLAGVLESRLALQHRCSVALNPQTSATRGA